MNLSFVDFITAPGLSSEAHTALNWPLKHTCLPQSAELPPLLAVSGLFGDAGRWNALWWFRFDLLLIIHVFLHLLITYSDSYSTCNSNTWLKRFFISKVHITKAYLSCTILGEMKNVLDGGEAGEIGRKCEAGDREDGRWKEMNRE